MRLVNCPICGARCSAEAEKCPECEFEIRKYFEPHNISNKNKPSSIPLVICVSIALISLLTVTFFIFARKPEVTDQEASMPVVDSASSAEETQLVSSEPVPASNEIDVSGVYSGDDHEILVLNSDGLAYYYCSEIAFTELECPWYLKDNNVYIDLSRLHCTVNAKANDKELLFKSDSANWNTELFTRLDVEPSQYLTKALSTHDPNATLNSDGTLTYTLDEISYTLPKSFIDYADESDYQPDWSVFIDEDAQSDYVSGMLFYKSHGEDIAEEAITKAASDFASRFLNNVSITSSLPTNVAGYPGYLCEVIGYYNRGFSGLQDYEVSGHIAIFYNEATNNNNFIMMTQNSHRSIDNTAIFEKSLQSAK